MNVSATLAAAVDATRADGSRATVLALPRRTPRATTGGCSSCAPTAARRRWAGRDGRAAHPRRRRDSDPGRAVRGGTRLWLAQVDPGGPLPAYLERHGRPIRYGYVPRRWPLADYQTVYALEPGSAEMPSAGRPFTTELVTRLMARGVGLAPVTLHTGVSSPERHEAPYPERSTSPRRPPARSTRRGRPGGASSPWAPRSSARWSAPPAPDGTVAAGTAGPPGDRPERGVRAVDGNVTGWHEPEASHLRMLEAIAGPELLRRSYDAALAAATYGTSSATAT